MAHVCNIGTSGWNRVNYVQLLDKIQCKRSMNGDVRRNMAREAVAWYTISECFIQIPLLFVFNLLYFLEMIILFFYLIKL
jgi:hypothetical protein